MTFLEGIKELARRFDKSSDLSKFRDLAEPAFNQGYLDVGKSWLWKELETYGSVVAEPLAEGKVTVTTGSQAVTISGASSEWAGWFFKESGGENTYRILRVNGNILTLDQPIIESGNIDYEIEKRFYTIPTEARVITAFDADPTRVMSLDNRGLRSRLPDYTPPLSDVPFHVYGSDKFVSVYEDGEATVAEGSEIVTGTGGTEWLANVLPGDIFSFGGVDYRVRRAEGDARLVLYNYSKSTATQKYEIVRDNAKTIRLRTEFTAKKVIPFNYIRSVFNLVHDDDRTELALEAGNAILDFGEAYLAQALNKDDWANRLLKAGGRLRKAQELASPVNAAYKQLNPLIPRGMGRG